ncbi:MAG: hypothetical protein C0417_00830 [Chlorobiaceae bacterium]|nr:hypothetical protein [Chlorobiaceae bacterium]
MKTSILDVLKYFICFSVLSSLSFAQSFESSPFIEFQGGVGMPAGSFTDAYQTGVSFIASAGVPLEGTVLASVQYSLIASNAYEPIVGVSGEFSFPFAPEASSTGYFLVGLGGIKIKKDWSFGLTTGAGYLFSPEQWKSIYLDFQLRYQRNFKDIAWQDFSISGGIGFHLFNQ